MVSLLHLPAELILLILTELSISSQDSQVVSQNLLSCRQTCRQLRESATPLIFETRHIIIEETSIGNLIRISETPHLAKHIQALQIHTLHLTPPKDLKRVIPSFMLGSNEGETAESDVISAPHENHLGSFDADTYQIHYEKQQELVTSRLTTKRLLGAFSRLEACTRITFDSENPAWDPFRLGQNLGTFVQRSQANPAVNFRFIMVLLFGVLTARSNGRSHLEVLEICSGHMIQKALCFMLTHLRRFPITVASLRRLRLVVERCFDKDMLKNFLGYFPGLTDLNLEMDSGEQVQDPNGVLSDLYVPALQKLKLVKVGCTATELEHLIIRHQKTLEDITLICIKLPDDQSWHPILQKIDENRKLIGFSMAKCLQDKDLELLSRLLNTYKIKSR